MKYIRTENGHIYEIETLGYDGFLIGHFKGADDNFNLYNYLRKWQLESKNKYYLQTPSGYTVCEKQADNIEELCDAFIHGQMVFRTLNECLEYAPLGGNINGAIWVDKNLICVAEMNDKGEFELL